MLFCVSAEITLKMLIGVGFVLCFVDQMCSLSLSCDMKFKITQYNVTGGYGKPALNLLKPITQTRFMFRMAPVLSLLNQEILDTITSFYNVTTRNRRECSSGSILRNAFLKQYRRGRHVQYVRLVTTGQIVVFRLAPSTSEFRFFTFHHRNVSKLLLVAKTNQ